VPYALKKTIEEELQSLEDLEVIENIFFSEWASPVVPVQYPCEAVRRLQDHHQPILHVDQYPMLIPKDLISTLTSGNIL